LHKYNNIFFCAADFVKKTIEVRAGKVSRSGGTSSNRSLSEAFLAGKCERVFEQNLLLKKYN